MRPLCRWPAGAGAIAAPVTGRLAPIDLDEGDPVRLGDTVAPIAPSPLDPRGRRQAEANLSTGRAALAEALARVAKGA